MTRRRKEDYSAVLKAFLDQMLEVKLKEILSDFEPALWSAVADILPEVCHYGCCFHWKQAVLRMVKNIICDL